MSSYEPYDAGPAADRPSPASSTAPASAPSEGRRACPACGGERFEPGFVEDAGEASQGYARWIPGPLERGLFGGARKFGKARFAIEAERCSACGHLTLFARSQV